jgi:acetyl esterase
MTITTKTAVVLERASQEFVDATSKPPFFWEGTPAEARKVLDDVQAEPIEKLPVDERWSPSLPTSATCVCAS